MPPNLLNFCMKSQRNTIAPHVPQKNRTDLRKVSMGKNENASLQETGVPQRAGRDGANYSRTTQTLTTPLTLPGSFTLTS